MTTKSKTYRPQFKTAGEDGTASWVMATLNQKDSDGDVTLPGAFGIQTFSIVPAHDHSHVPLGKANLREEGDEAIVDAKFNLNIPAARDWHAAIKFDMENPPAVQEYSYAYNLHDGGWKMGDHNGERVRFFHPKADGSPGVDVYESSPVLRGAGLGTRTIEAKSLKFPEHAESVLADVDELVTRASEILVLRAEKGKGIAPASADLMVRLTKSLDRLREMMAEPVPDTSSDDFRREYARFVILSQKERVA